jgi:acetyltransferase-like isoleucine patch superfamily enzyme
MSDELPEVATPPLPPWATVGRHTYGYTAETFRIFMVGARIEIGAFCSIGPEVRILAGSEHITTRASTFPFKALLFNPSGGNANEAIDRGTTVVGHDVWIGLGATILSGVLIGHGVVIGAGAVVSKAVPPYAVVVGNPARIIRYRHSEDVRRRLIALAWWDWSDDEIAALEPLLSIDAVDFVEQVERRYESRGEDDLTLRLRALPRERMTPDRSRSSMGFRRPGSGGWIKRRN